MSAPTTRDRARGALWGLAVGDALGMPAEGLPRALVAQRYGLIDRFHPGHAEDNEIAGDLPAGHVTDDTDQAVIVGRLLVDGAGRVDATELAERLLAWQERMRAAGAASLLGPSTLRALQHIRTHGPSPTSGRWGDTNGAAMRIAPVGVATAARPLQVLVDRVVAVSEPTHNTHVALAGAAAVAAAVAVAVDGAGLPEALDAATAAARSGATRGFYTAAPSLAGRLECAVRLTLEAAEAASGAGEAEQVEAGSRVIDEVVGTSLITQESVPAAFAVLALADAVRPGGAADPWWVCRIAASLGGDCDTIAAMAGAVAGALGGRQALPAEAVDTVARRNPTLDLDTLAEDLLELRR
ncbi:ADP-ribosylglycohydrolase family protein [Georgenia thermotolerans]|uniref:ADP-ribosylglycohydrolase family protein n=1 Tax=Georgenia thermotolerans TaxID=527326 RepID=A0A7J5UMK3_9MICO|nr:ADP-ribosylglycohydrolase family protein [Georgenia thermotolerans]KAE8763609.1 ADP-ribosylglycohydrolase family protein [Georgenia thermotolerans]